jgi:WXG100 family type VII secretion target
MKGKNTMSDLISVGRHEVVNTASKFDQKASELEDLMQQIKSQIASMMSWKGDAQVDFTSVMAEWNNEINQVRTTLADISSRLKRFENDIANVDSGTKF